MSDNFEPTPNWREKLRSLSARIPALKSNLKGLGGSIEDFDLARVSDWAAHWSQTALNPQKSAFYGTAATILISSWFIADLTSLMVGRFIPEAPPSRGALFRPTSNFRGGNEEDLIVQRNLFSSRSLLPGEDGDGGPIQDQGGNPVRTSLPIALIGTLILADELKSIGTIEDRTAGMVYPIRANDEIPAKLKVIKVEPSRVVFVNSATGRREFVELPVDANAQPAISVSGPRTSGGGIEQVAPNQFSVPRSEIEKAFSDINNVLTQARAVANFKNGVPHGYKLFQVVPNSIFSKLGVKDNDTILGFDGEAINDPAAALNKLGLLKTANRVEIQIERDGRPQTMTFDIN